LRAEISSSDFLLYEMWLISEDWQQIWRGLIAIIDLNRHDVEITTIVAVIYIYIYVCVCVCIYKCVCVSTWGVKRKLNYNEPNLT
jgi:hypothetical protein